MSPTVNYPNTNLKVAPQLQIQPYSRPLYNNQSFTKPASSSNSSTQLKLDLPSSIATFGLVPVAIYHGISAIANNISSFNDSARAQRQEDQSKGKGVLAGAQDFSNSVKNFYEYLGKVDTSKLTRDQILPHLGGIAQEYMQKEAGVQILGAVKEQFPETMQEIESVFSGSASTATTSLQTGVSAGQQAVTESASTLGSIGGQVMGWAGAAYSLYEIFKGKLDPQGGALSGAAAGAYIGSAIWPGAGTVVGAVIGGVGGYLSGMFKSGKPAEQKERDAVRKQLLAAGILDSNWNIALANGGSFDMGKDGGAKLLNKDGTERKYKEFDNSNPLSQVIAQVAAPLAQSIAGGNARLAQEFTAYFTNAAISNTDSVQGALHNLQVIYAKFGVPIQKVLQNLAQQQASAIKMAA